MSLVKGTEIPTIDVNLVTVSVEGGAEIALDTASSVAVEPQIETIDAVKLIVKGVLKAQKLETSTLTGHKITLKDNVFTPELVKILQGGTIIKDTEGSDPNKIIGYRPPVVGSNEKGSIFTLHCYSAQYNTAGQIVQYERTTYPNCQGVPVAFGAEDGTFRVNEYTINSAPANGESPYEIDYVASLPTIS